QADARLDAALRRYAVDGRQAPVLAALSRSRLLVPVVALVGEVEQVNHRSEGLLRDKTADIAAVLMQGQDGRTALLAFSGLTSLQDWQVDARPVPVSVEDAARSAVQEGAAALVIDVAGPTAYVVETHQLHELARGHVLVETPNGYAWLAPPAPPERM
ncbi:MAG TPA: SseB family protein, partial [Actinomycetes bacterium]|nr:SseB family protein [Actinomycetes bacterium]